ncbi:MAG: MaoC/PaaZ C-terminal domain-containing protein [Bacillota bacterium]|jgi:acyl dehydratase|nr:acyl dehydratase [Clostridia bacterium]
MYYDDFTVGQKFFLEPVTISEAEILEFAKKYDPLPIHIDPEFAKNSLFGGIIASGFHTLCAIHAKMIKLRIVYEEVIGGLGIDYLQWSNPVHPNDTLRGEVEITEKIPSSKGGQGILAYRVVVRNQDDQLVMTYQVKSLVKSRN